MDQLDSLRGLAALSVVFHHHLLVFPSIWLALSSFHYLIPESALFLPPLYLLWAGHPAVILFFILSGYVLSLPLLKGRQPPYPYYAVKRICRIYLPYIVAVTAAILGARLLSRGPIPELSDWFRTAWTAPTRPRDLLDHVLMLPAFDTQPFNGAIWSLVHEMRISLVFPFLAILAIRLRWQWALAIAGCLSLASCSLLGGWLGWEPSYRMGSYAATVHYSAMFIVGAILARHQPELSRLLRSASSAFWFVLIACGIVLYLSTGIHPLARMPRLMHLFELVTAAGAAILVVCAAAGSWLRSKATVWLGRVSYSLYLWHLPVLLATIHVGYGHLPLWILLPLSIALSLVTAEVMCRLVEVPAIALAKRIGSKASSQAEMAPAALLPLSLEPAPLE